MWQRSFELAMEAPKLTNKPEVKAAWEGLQREVAAAHDLAVRRSRANLPTWATDVEREAMERQLGEAEQALQLRVEAAKSARAAAARARRAAARGSAGV